MRSDSSRSSVLRSLIAFTALSSVLASCSDAPAPSTGRALVASSAQALSVRYSDAIIVAPSRGHFGATLAHDGDTIFVGAPFANVSELLQAGAVDIFTKKEESWLFVEELTAETPFAGGTFGTSLAASKALVVVGQDGDTKWAEVHTRRGDSWEERTSLARPVESVTGDKPDAIATDGDFIVIGSYRIGNRAGAAYVYSRSSGAWKLEQALPATGLVDASDGDTGKASHFGYAAAIDGGTIVVSSHNPTDEQKIGVVHVFDARRGDWQEIALLLPEDSWSSTGFGTSVAISGSRILVGAPSMTVAGLTKGAVYVFERTSDGFAQTGMFTSEEPSAGGYFGQTLHLEGDVAVVGAPYEVVGAVASGAAHVFSAAGGAWQEQLRLSANDELAFGIGNSVDYAAGRVLVGNQDTDVGRVYSYAVGVANGSPCARPAECLSTHCADGLCCDTPCRGECDACSAERGAAADGRCAVLPRASDGLPLCAPLVCNGVSAECAECTGDEDCPEANFCAASGRCEARRPQGEACNPAAGKDCTVTGCRVCDAGSFGCVDGLCCNTACDGVCERCLEGVCGRDPGCAVPGETAGGSGGAGGMNEAGGDSFGGTRDHSSGAAGSSSSTPNGSGQSGEGGHAGDAHEMPRAGATGGEESCSDDRCAPYRCRDGRCAVRCETVDDCLDDDDYCTVDGHCAPMPMSAADGGCGLAARSPRTALAHIAALASLALALRIGIRRRCRVVRPTRNRAQNE